MAFRGLKILLLIIGASLCGAAYGQKIQFQLDEVYLSILDKRPEFKYGNDSLHNFFQVHLVYPEKAIDSNISGQVMADFTINANGGLDTVWVSRAPHQLLGNEVERVVRMTDGMWQPGKINRRPVPVKCRIPVEFVLEDDEMPSKKDSVYDQVDSLPEFIGGNEAYMDFIRHNLTYTHDEVPQAYVKISLVIGSDSSVRDAYCVQDCEISQEMTREVIRVIRLSSKKWKPAKTGNEFVNYRTVLVIAICADE